MKENAKVQNPLTIISIFAGLAEIAGTVVLIGLPLEIQRVFVWFVMLFPSILVVIFFIILSKIPDVLYAPSDFSNEDNYMQIRLRKRAYRDFEAVEKSKEELKEIVSNLDESIGNENTEVKAEVKAANQKIRKLEKQLFRAEKTVRKMGTKRNRFSDFFGTINAKDEILRVLEEAPHGLTAEEIDERIGINELPAVALILRHLVQQEKIRYEGMKYWAKSEE